MIYLLAILLLLIFIGSIFANRKDISAPAVVFSFGFAFQAFWAVLYHKAWRLDLHLNTFLVLFLGVLEFFLVTMFVKFIAHKIKPREYKTKPFVMQEIKTNKVLEWIYLGVSILISLVYLYYLVRAVNGTFTSIKSIMQSISDYDIYLKFSDEFENGIPFIVKNLNLAVIYSGYWFLYVIINNYFYNKKIRLVQILVFVSALCAALMSGSRTPVIMMAIAGICYYLILLFKKKSYKNLFTKKMFIYMLILGAAAIGLFFPTAKLLGRKTDSKPLDYLSIYCGAEVKNLDTFLQEKEYLFKYETIGSQTMYNLIQFASDKLHLKDVETYRLDLPFRKVDNIDLGNVYTTFYAYIYDFGYIGLFVFVFIMAAICASLYEYLIRLRKLDKPKLSVLVYGVFFGCLLLSFFSNKFYEELFSPVFIKKIITWFACSFAFCWFDFKKIKSFIKEKLSKKSETNVKKNYIYNLIYQVVAIILPIISTPYISKVLGAKNIGIYGYTLSISAYFVLAGTLGMTLYGQREIAYLQKDKEKYSKVFFEVFFLKLMVMCLSALVFFIFFVRGNNHYNLFYKILLLELLAHVLDVSWFFQGLEEFKKTVTRNFIVKVVSVACIFIFVKEKSDLPIYFLIYVLSMLIGNLSLWLSIPKYVCKTKIDFKKIFRHLPPTFIMFIPQVAIQVYTVLDRTMIGKIISDKTQVGYYTQGENLIKLLLTIITSLGTVMLPRIANSFAEKNYDKIRDYIYKAFNLVFLLSFPMISGIVMVADIFVPKFFGPGYDGVSIIMKVISPILLFIGMSNVIGVQYLLPTKRQKEYTTSVIIGACINFVVNLILIRRFAAVGAAIGTVVAEAMVTLMQMIFVRKDLKIIHIFKIALHYVLPTLIMTVCCFLIKRQVGTSAKAVVLIAGFGVFVYGICLLFFKNQFVMDTLNSLITRVKKIIKK